MDKLTFTRKLIKEGFKLFPCDVNNKPALNLGDFENEFHDFNKTLEKEIQLTSFRFNHNLAILTGETNQIVVVDIDIKFNGTRVWKALLNRFNEGKDIETFKVSTPSGGVHYYFKYEKKDFHRFESIYRPNIKGYGKVGIDIIAENGYVMSPFSTKNSNQYLIQHFMPKLAIKNQIKPMPDWLISIFRNCREAIIRRLVN